MKKGNRKIVLSFLFGALIALGMVLKVEADWGNVLMIFSVSVFGANFGEHFVTNRKSE